MDDNKKKLKGQFMCQPEQSHRLGKFTALAPPFKISISATGKNGHQHFITEVTI